MSEKKNHLKLIQWTIHVPIIDWTILTTSFFLLFASRKQKKPILRNEFNFQHKNKIKNETLNYYQLYKTKH